MQSKKDLIEEIEEVCMSDMAFFCNPPINGLELAMLAINHKLNSLTKIEVEQIHAKARKSPDYKPIQETKP